MYAANLHIQIIIVPKKPLWFKCGLYASLTKHSEDSDLTEQNKDAKNVHFICIKMFEVQMVCQK